MTEIIYLSTIIISVGSFVFGVLPMVFSFRVSNSSPFFLSLILCLGGGVLLATSLVHMLTEVQVKLKSTAQLYYCIGFFALYAFDEMSHYCLDRKKQCSLLNDRVRARISTDYGAADSPGFSENSPFLESIQPKNKNSNFTNKNQTCCSERYKEKTMKDIQINSYCSAENREDENICSLSTIEHWSSNSAAKTGLFIAILIHSILEGVSIGVQTKTSQIILILGAVTFHKIVLSFCLGLELYTLGLKRSHYFLAILLLSLGSPFGILVGTTVISLEGGIFSIDSELQAVAAGTLLYVAAFEVLPRERFKWQQGGNFNAAGIFQLIFTLIGFGCITGFHFLVDSRTK